MDVSRDSATALALEYLHNPGWEPAVTDVEDAGDAWRIFYNSRVYVETGESSHALAGNLPLLIDKHSGDITTDLTYMPGTERWWFHERGFGVTVERDADRVYWAHLTRLPSGEVVAPDYGRGESAAEAVASAKRRYEVEQ